MTMTTTDRAAQIRQTLKGKGITSRQVSVRADYFSGGSSIDVRIKDANVSLSLVESIANAHERIDRCHLTHEILSGCNRYVSVSYTSAALDVLAARYLDAVNAAAAQASGSNLIPVTGTDFWIGRNDNGVHFSLWTNDSHVQSYLDAAGAAAAIGIRSL